MNYPMQTGNYLLILLGIILVLSGPWITYKTLKAVREIRARDPKESIHPISNGLNLLIAVLFFLAGILFIINNLRGTPLT